MDCDAIAEKMITVVCSIYKSLMEAGEYVSIICNAADCVTHEPVVIENGTDIDIVLESMARIDAGKAKRRKIFYKSLNIFSLFIAGLNARYIIEATITAITALTDVVIAPILASVFARS